MSVRPCGRDPPGEAARAVPAAEAPIGDPRWPPAVALFVYMALTITLRVWLPHDSTVRVSWLLPSIEAALILLLLLGNPSRLGKTDVMPLTHRAKYTMMVQSTVALALSG
jgi:hypothetical protein